MNKDDGSNEKVNISVNNLLIILSTFILGLAKGGLKGITPAAIILMTLVFSAKTSMGIIVPLLIVGDIMALLYYKNYIKLEYVKSFLPSVLAGLFIGGWIGKEMSEQFLGKWIAVLIVLSLIILWLWENYLKERTVQSPVLNAILGIGAGFYSMIGNFAGAFANIYFLMTRLPKNELIGTATFIFFIANILKVPFHIWIWNSISVETLYIDLWLIPIMIIGFYSGTVIIKNISEIWFRRFLYLVTIVGMVIIFLK